MGNNGRVTLDFSYYVSSYINVCICVKQIVRALRYHKSWVAVHDKRHLKLYLHCTHLDTCTYEIATRVLCIAVRVLAIESLWHGASN